MEPKFKLILNSKEFLIPSCFPSFNDANPHICSTLISKGQYRVKSSVSRLVFQAFLNHWVYNKRPNILIDNIDQYDSLSQEFDRMKDLICIFKKLLPNTNCSYLRNRNQQLNLERETSVYKLNKKKEKFHLIIDHLFQNSGLDSHQRFLEIKSDLFEAAKKENEKMVDLLTKKEIKHESGLSFALNEHDKTAGVFKIFLSKKSYFIPRSVNYENEEYLVTTIHESVFQKSDAQTIIFDSNSELKTIEKYAFGCTEIASITIPRHVRSIGKSAFYYSSELEEVIFSENSELEIIESYAFQGTDIRFLSIPSSIQVFGKEWCYNISDLTKIKILPSDKENVILYDEKFLIGKSINSEDFDRLLFAQRYIEEAEIPSFVKIIETCAFDNCQKLQTVTFSKSSQLEKIENGAFSETSIRHISFPDSLTKIGFNCFFDCTKLQSAEFSANSKITSIGENAFSYNTMKSFLCNPNPEEEYMNHMYGLSDFDDPFNAFGMPFQFNQNEPLIGRPNRDRIRFHRNHFDSITTISIPSCIADLKGEWCGNTPSLIRINIIKNETENIRLIEGKMIVGKSDPSKDVFDILHFAARDIENAVIPSYIRKIAASSFSDCYDIQKVEFSEDSQLEVIERFAFHKTAIESITIPAHVVEIAEYAFDECTNLKKVNFAPNSELRIIGKYAFMESSIEKISIPANVEIIKDDWCYEAQSPKSIWVDPGNKNFKFVDGQFLVGKSAKSIQKFDKIFFALRDIKDATIPSFITSLSPNAFRKCMQLKKVNFAPDSEMTKIDARAFSDSVISEVTIPASVTRIGEHAFCDCSSLETVCFSEGSKLKIIEKNAFHSTAIKKVVIPQKVEIIEFGAFGQCKQLETVEFEKNSLLYIIGQSSFFNSRIQSILIPSSVTRIEDSAFLGCDQLTTVEFLNDSKLVFIGSKAFSETSIESITIPPHVLTIGERAFANCLQLKCIQFSESSQLQIINDQAFYDTAIKSILIPPTVLVIGKAVFEHCVSLKNVEFPENSKLKFVSKCPFKDSKIESISMPSNFSCIQNGIFTGTQYLTTVKLLPCSENSILHYDGNFILGKSDGCNENYDILVFARRDIEESPIPPFIRYISTSAFQMCTVLETVDLSKLKIEKLNKNTFSNSSIKSITISAETKIIEQDCFSDCNQLVAVNFEPNSKLTKIGIGAFYKTSIVSISIPPHVKKIPQSCFYKCTNLRKIEFTEDSELCQIEFESLYKTKITSFSVPPNVSNIDRAFIKCDELKIIEINEKSIIKEIDLYCFDNFFLKDIMVPHKLINEINFKEDHQKLFW
ncbi:hypothetical protein M9Y10_030001 [Tritrichomonas musculus]|uniref:Surface antigen BspA-like n=1 Tax=Tritrichomonas musculus TaxID=1915356 RepID=A0ABR2KS21_9EUKA